MVADIYTTAVQQGPSMPQANRSMNTMRYSTNQTLYVARINGALDTVIFRPCASDVHAFYCENILDGQLGKNMRLPKIA